MMIKSVTNFDMVLFMTVSCYSEELKATRTTLYFIFWEVKVIFDVLS